MINIIYFQASPAFISIASKNRKGLWDVSANYLGMGQDTAVFGAVFRLHFMQFPMPTVVDGEATVRMLQKLLNPVHKSYLTPPKLLNTLNIL